MFFIFNPYPKALKSLVFCVQNNTWHLIKWEGSNAKINVNVVSTPNKILLQIKSTLI